MAIMHLEFNEEGPMNIEKTPIPGCLVYGGTRVLDSRGWFYKGYASSDSGADLLEGLAIAEVFWTESSKYVTRGLHFQTPPHSVSKFVTCLSGNVVDFVLDMRVDLPSYGKLVTVLLDGEKAASISIPRGCAHGFFTVSDSAVVHYLQSGHFDSDHDTGVDITPYLEESGLDPRKAIRSDRDRTFGALSTFPSWNTSDWIGHL
jgi:dTDP-4-dehydrorhamnose 3,5-epimerase